MAIVTDTQAGDLVVAPIIDDLSWGVGSIQPRAGLDGTASQEALVQAVIASLTPVTDDEAPYSSCTDGRLPLALLNGEPVPVREQIVGTDTMLFFHMAEALGKRFYKDPDAPLADRLAEVVAFMQDSGLKPCTHVACGAAAGYVAITKNLVNFTRNADFIARQHTFLPEGTYDPAIREAVTAGYEDRLARGVYDAWNAELLMGVVEHTSGNRAIAELNDDGRGVHGHVEEMIVRLQLDGFAIDEAKVAAVTGGREVFGVNDARLLRHAALMGRGVDEDYKIALMAAEDFTDGGHGTLAKDLPTYILRVN